MPRKDKGKNAQDFKKWYEKNREVQYARVKERKIKISQEIRDYKEANPCSDCGDFHPHYVMDFDHIDKENKKFNISQKAMSGSRKILWDEIAKCELVCSNCHRYRTHRHQ